MGHALAVEVGLEVPAGSLAYWGSRLTKYGATVGSTESRFGVQVLPVVDPPGLKLALHGWAAGAARPFTAGEQSTVPAERQILGLHSARLWERHEEATAAFL